VKPFWVLAALLLLPQLSHAMTVQEYERQVEQLISEEAAWKQMRAKYEDELEKATAKRDAFDDKNDPGKKLEKYIEGAQDLMKGAGKGIRPAIKGGTKGSLDVAKIAINKILPAANEMGSAQRELGEIVANQGAISDQSSRLEKAVKDASFNLAAADTAVQRTGELLEVVSRQTVEGGTTFTRALGEFVGSAMRAGQRIQNRKREQARLKREANDAAWQRHLDTAHERHPGPVMGPPVYNRGGGTSGRPGPSEPTRPPPARPSQPPTRQPEPKPQPTQPTPIYHP
jgi:hypothetical protein